MSGRGRVIMALSVRMPSLMAGKEQYIPRIYCIKFNAKMVSIPNRSIYELFAGPYGRTLNCLRTQWVGDIPKLGDSFRYIYRARKQTNKQTILTTDFRLLRPKKGLFVGLCVCCCSCCCVCESFFFQKKISFFF